MKSTTSPPSLIRGRRIIIALLLVAAGWGFRSLLSDSDGGLRLFGRSDVWFCSLALAAPLGILLAAALSAYRFAHNLLVAAALAGTALAIASGSAVDVDSAPGWPLVFAARCMLPIAVAGAVAILTNLNRRTFPVPERNACSGSAFVASAVLAVVVPALYADTVSNHLRIQIQQSLANERVALAQAHAAKLRQLQPSARIADTTIQGLRATLDQRLDALRTEADSALPPTASTSTVARRVQVLMQLDRCDEALPLLYPLTHGDRFHPASFDYIGLCYQRLGEASKSLSAYQQAILYWHEQSDSRVRRESLASAWKGIAFAARQMDDRALEEHAYRQAVDAVPSGAHHLMLAQCYSEHQKTKLAAEHAAIARELAPELLPRTQAIHSALARDHFGCFQVPLP